MFESCSRLMVVALVVVLAASTLACVAGVDGAAGRAVPAEVVPPQSSPVAVAGDFVVVTDLDESGGPVASLKLLLGPRTRVVHPGAATAEVLATGTRGVVVLSVGTGGAADLLARIRRYVESGRTAVIDTTAYAAMTGRTVEKAVTDHVRIVRESDVASGLKVGDCLPLHGPGGLLALPGIKDADGTTVLAVAGPEALPALVEQRVGTGRLVVTDLSTPGEPYVWHPGTMYKYLFTANAIGNRARFGVLWPRKPSHAELVEQMKSLAAKHPSLVCRNEGRASDGQDIYSLSIGDAEAPGLLILGCVHGNEWENALGLVTFVRCLVERPADVGFDPAKVRLTVVPVVCPYGYDHVSRLNGNGVNLNRNGDVVWEEYRADDTDDNGTYGPGDQDWKGAAPLGEPETQVLMRIVAGSRFQAALDLHSNPSGTGYNKLMSPRSSAPGAVEATEAFGRRFTERVTGRYVLRQQHEKTVKLIVNERVWQGKACPTLSSSSGFLAGGRHSVLVELPGGFWMDDPRVSAYGTFLCTDLVSELCVAFMETYGVRQPGMTNSGTACSTSEGEQP